MKKILSALFALYLIVPASYGQKEKSIRQQSVGISFFLNDFLTPERIRTTSLNKVISDKKFAKMSDMTPGLAVSYFKGVSNHVDVAGTIGGSFLNYPMKGKSFGDNFLLEVNAQAHLKMTTEAYWVQPFIAVGVGAHKYRSYYGAFLPLGLGVKVNFFDEAHLFVTSTYRVPVTTETASYHLLHSIGIAGTIGKKN